MALRSGLPGFGVYGRAAKANDEAVIEMAQSNAAVLCFMTITFLAKEVVEHLLVLFSANVEVRAGTAFFTLLLPPFRLQMREQSHVPDGGQMQSFSVPI